LKDRYQKLKPILHGIILKNPSYGYRRLKDALAKKGIVINHKLLKKLLRTWGLSLPRKLKRKRRSGIEQILTELGAKVNLVKTLSPSARFPFRVVYTDFTEIICRAGKAYLIVFLDDISKRILGYAIGLSATTQLALQAFSKAKQYLARKNIGLSSMIIHQDQGKPFTSYEYVLKLTTNGITPSYSRKGCPQDNPGMESFYGRLKDECDHLFKETNSFDELKRLVQQSLRYYNRSRIHSELNGKSPDEFLNSFPAVQRGSPALS
jgi:putative transposase